MIALKEALDIASGHMPSWFETYRAGAEQELVAIRETNDALQVWISKHGSTLPTYLLLLFSHLDHLVRGEVTPLDASSVKDDLLTDLADWVKCYGQDHPHDNGADLLARYQALREEETRAPR